MCILFWRGIRASHIYFDDTDGRWTLQSLKSSGRMSKLSANFSKTGYPFGRLTWNVQVQLLLKLARLLFEKHRLTVNIRRTFLNCYCNAFVDNDYLVVILKTIVYYFSMTSDCPAKKIYWVKLFLDLVWEWRSRNLWLAERVRSRSDFLRLPTEQVHLFIRILHRLGDYHLDLCTFLKDFHFDLFKWYCINLVIFNYTIIQWKKWNIFWLLG